MGFTQEEEGILRLIIDDLRAKMLLTIAREDANVASAPLQEDVAIKQKALKDKFKV